MKFKYFIDKHRNLYVFGENPDEFYTKRLKPVRKIPKKRGSYIYFDSDETQEAFYEDNY
jgi:hypothetical protein